MPIKTVPHKHASEQESNYPLHIREDYYVFEDWLVKFAQALTPETAGRISDFLIAAILEPQTNGKETGQKEIAQFFEMVDALTSVKMRKDVLESFKNHANESDIFFIMGALIRELKGRTEERRAIGRQYDYIKSHGL